MDAGELIQRIGRMFYIVNPWNHMFPDNDFDSVPDYIAQSELIFFFMAIVETLIIVLKLPHRYDLADGIASVSSGLLRVLFVAAYRGSHFAAYTWVHSKINLVSLPWDNIWVWVLSFFAVDFGYYVFHRASHEVNVFWAVHVVHHSSQYYNLTTALRQAIVQPYITPLFYIPTLVVASPVYLVVHDQLMTLYQFWVHTELVPKLGPLEYILNTPSHHRVHHGSNRYCIDKNYGGTLIIWDRLFGTFAEEHEEVVYGLTHNIETFNPWTIQTHHFAHILQQLWSNNGIVNKAWVLLKGPGWSVGKPRLGDPSDIPDVHAPVTPYRKSVPLSLVLFACFTGSNVLFFASPILPYNYVLPFPLAALCLTFCLSQILALGLLFDRSVYALYLHLVTLPAMAGIAAYCLQTKATYFHVLFSMDATQPDALNAGMLVLFVALSCWLVAAGPWTDDEIPQKKQVGKKTSAQAALPAQAAPAPRTPPRTPRSSVSPSCVAINSTGASPRSPVSRELKGLSIDSPQFQYRGASTSSRLRSGKELW